MRHIILFCASLALSSCWLDSKDPVEPSIYDCDLNIENTHPKSAEFQEYIELQVSKGLPGMTMLVESPEGIWLGSAGLADLEHRVEMEPCHVHRIGSTTKTFTATVVLQLVENNLIQLDENISHYLTSEEFKRIPNFNQVTVRQLLNHSSGIPDFLDLNYSLNYLNNPNRLWTDKEELSMIYDEDPVFAPGSKVQYSNSNFALLGLIAKEVTEQSGSELFEQFIFSPLEMNHSFFSETTNGPDQQVRGYLDDDGEGNLIDITQQGFVATSMAGGAFSTVHDLFLFQKAIWESEMLLSDSTKEMILTLPDIPFLNSEKAEYGNENAVNRTLGFGLCWWQDDTDYGTCVWHGGSTLGRKCAMRYFPDSQTSIIYLINGGGESLDDLHSEIRNDSAVRLVFEP